MESQKAGDKWWSPLGRLGLSSTVQSSPSKPTRGEREREGERERSETKSNRSLFSRGKMDVFWIGTVAKYH